MKKRVIVLLFVGMLGLCACESDKSVTQNETPNTNIDVETQTEEIQIDPNSEIQSESDSGNKIVEDDVVNNFLNECQFEYGEIEKGNIKTKYFVHISDCRTELLDSNTDELIITINGYHIDNVNEEEVLDAFKLVEQTINGNEYDDEVNKLIDGLKEHNTDIYNGEIGQMKYNFKGFVELTSGGVSESRMEIYTTKYNID